MYTKTTSLCRYVTHSADKSTEQSEVAQLNVSGGNKVTPLRLNQCVQQQLVLLGIYRGV